MNLFFLSSNFVPQHVMWIKQLIHDYGVTVHSIHISKTFTYVPDDIPSFHAYKKSGMSRQEMLEKIIDAKPALMYVAGYADKDFLWLGKKVRKNLGIPVVSGCDTQWRGEWRQRIGSWLSPWLIQPSFSHFIVAGVYQFEWVRKLGYKKEQILFNMYSGNTGLFNQCDLERKAESYPRNFVYIGRFVEQKGISYLVDAWKQVADKKNWTLTLIGDGPLKQQFSGVDTITIKDYMDQEQLLVELSNSGCFILPSVFEPWAVVIHECACAGLPMITTDVCGATPHFVIDGYNGVTVPPRNTDALRSAMETIINRSDDELYKMSVRSRKLGNNITQEISAASLMSVLNK